MQLSNSDGAHRNTQMYWCQYANVFDKDNTLSYSGKMTKMREILGLLMAVNGDNAYSLQTKSGVPQPTTQRFLSGKNSDPRSSTVKKWADVYRVTESQLRGDVPIEGVTTGAIAKPSKSDSAALTSLTHEQQQMLALMGGFDKRTREALLKALVLLAQSNQSLVTDAPIAKEVDTKQAQQIELEPSSGHSKGKDSAFRTFKAPELLKIPGTSRGDGKKTPKEEKK